MQYETYVGKELELFSQAKKWKNYWSCKISPFVQGRVLEVGCGLGSNTKYLLNETVTEIFCVEPDANLVKRAQESLSSLTQAPAISVQRGTLESLSDQLSGQFFDTIVYLDVLEHIENDRAELKRAAQLLRDSGRIIVVAPAHNILYSEFDKAIGHYRRYSTSALRELAEDGLRIQSIFQIDSLGMFLSLTNRFLLKKSIPTIRDIRFWDKYVVPMSQIIDPMLGYRLGKTVVAVFSHRRV